MQPSIQDFIACKRIGVVGVSRAKGKFGNAAYTELKKRGYQVSAVHRSEKEIAGIPCVPNLKALQGQIDGVLVSVQPSQAVSVLEEAASIGVRNVWLQQGAESEDVLRTAERLRLNAVSKKCILMYALPVGSIHKWHRAIVRVFGRL